MYDDKPINNSIYRYSNNSNTLQFWKPNFAFKLAYRHICMPIRLLESLRPCKPRKNVQIIDRKKGDLDIHKIADCDIHDAEVLCEVGK